MPACSSVQTNNTLQIKWDSLPSLPGIHHKANPGVAGAFSGTSHQRLIVAGGANFPDQPVWKNGTKKYWDIIYVLPMASKNKRWTNYFYHLPFPVAYGASVNIHDGILCIGGKNDSGYLSTVLLLQWNEQENRITIKDLPDLPLPLSGLSAAKIENTVYIAGGENKNGKQAAFYKLDLDNLQAGWKELPSLPNGPLSNVVLVAQSDGHQQCLYLIGGRTTDEKGKTAFFHSTWKYDPAKEKWFQKQDIADKNKQPVSLAAGTGVAVNDHFILLFGGDDGILFNELADYKRKAQQETDSLQKQYWQERHDSLFIHHPGFNKQIFLYNTLNDSWTTVGQLPFLTQVTTNCFKYNGNIFITSGEVRPGIRTPDIKKATITF